MIILLRSYSTLGMLSDLHKHQTTAVTQRAVCQQKEKSNLDAFCALDFAIFKYSSMTKGILTICRLILKCLFFNPLTKIMYTTFNSIYRLKYHGGLWLSYNHSTKEAFFSFRVKSRTKIKLFDCSSWMPLTISAPTCLVNIPWEY